MMKRKSPSVQGGLKRSQPLSQIITKSP